VDIAILVVYYHNIINQIVAIQVEIVYPGIFIIEVSFKLFKGFRLLEKLHYRIKVQIVARETKVFFRPILRSGGGGCHGQEC
jgi:hypothetical protein